MGEKTVLRQALKIVFLCACWYSISAANNVLIKQIFQVFPHPMTVTMVHLLAVCAFLGPTLTVLNVEPTPYVSRRFFLRIMVPLAIGKLFASLSGHVSILKVPLSYAHTGIHGDGVWVFNKDVLVIIYISIYFYIMLEMLYGCDVKK